MLLDWILTPLSYAFMQRGLAAALMVGVLCAVIGCYVVLRSMAFLGDAIAHSILPGIAVAYIAGVNLTIGALVAGIFVALGVGVLSKRGTIKEDTAIGILFSAALAAGVALISSIRSYAVDLSHILFGNILGVGSLDLAITAGIGLVVLLCVFALFRPFMVVSFDPILAATLRMPVSLLRNLMLVLIALTIVVSIQTVGVGLAAAMLVTPAATAYLLTRRLSTMMVISALIGALASFVGLYISYYANIASGAAIVLTVTAFFLFAFLFAPNRGYLVRSLKSA